MLPFVKRKSSDPPFYALDDELPLVLAISSGLQHALAMLAGLITPPIIFASTLNLPPDVSAYMISASLIGCGEYDLGIHGLATTLKFPFPLDASSELLICHFRHSKSRPDI